LLFVSVHLISAEITHRGCSKVQCRDSGFCRRIYLDINLHKTNACYLSFMDLGRMDLLLRAGMLET
jgi:hypothetical protein